MLTSFNLHFLANNEGAYASHDFPVEQGHSASPIKYGVVFFLKLFMAVGGQVLWINLLGDCFWWGLMIRSCQRQEGFTNASSSIQNLKILKFLPIMKEYILEDKAVTIQQNCGSIYL